MAVGKVTYSGGSGVRGGVETTYTIHSESEQIKAGNFVEKVTAYTNSEAVAQNLVLETTGLTDSAITAIGNNRLLAAQVSLTYIKLQLYDTTTSAVPQLLDETMLPYDSVTSVDLLTMSNNLAVIAFTFNSTVRAAAISVEGDNIKYGTTETALSFYSIKVKLCKFNSNRFAIYTNSSSNAARFVAYKIDSNLKLSEPTTFYSYNGITNTGYINVDQVVDNKVIVAYNESNSDYQLGLSICTYNTSTNTITKGATSIISGTQRLPQAIKTLSPTRAVVVYQPNNAALNAVLVTMDSSATSQNMTISEPISLKTGMSIIQSLNIVEYETGKYMLIYDNTATLLNITDTTVTLGSSQSVSSIGASVDCAVPITNRVSILYLDGTKYPNLNQVSVSGTTIGNIVPTFIPYHEITKATTKIDGVAKNSGVAGDTIKVYVLGGDE